MEPPPAVLIDPTTFWRRINALRQLWNHQRQDQDQNNSTLATTDAILITTGKLDEDETYSKSAAIQIYLFGIEFTNSVFILGARALHVLSDAKKIALFAQLNDHEDQTIPLELHTKDKTDGFAKNFETLLDAIRSSHAGATVAALLKEKPKGPFADAWRARLAADDGPRQVELSPAIAQLLAAKEATELACVKRAAVFSAQLLQKHLVARIESVIDEEKKISHEKLATETEDAFGDPKKLGVNLSAEHLEPCYTPIIQSGGNFDLRPSAYSNDDNLHDGTITCSLGARFKSYCANVGRTYIINPTREQEKTYKLLLELQQEALAALKPGATLAEVYGAVVSRLRNKNATLEPNLTRTVGFATGIEFRESSLQLNAKSTEARVRPGMVFNLALGFDKLDNPKAPGAKDKTYALFLADTVTVPESGPAEVLTDRAPKAWKEVSYYLRDDDGDGDGGGGGGGGDEALGRTRGKNKVDSHAETNESLSSHQAELEEQMKVEALRRLRNGEGGGASAASGPLPTPIAYRDPNSYPAPSAGTNSLKTNTSYVDGKAEALLLPLFGRLVPFHISTVKNVSKHEEGAWTFLRINFVAPGQSGFSAGQMPPESNESSHFVKELTLKAKTSHATNLNNTFRLIKELRKRVSNRLKQVELEADIIEQPALQRITAGKIHRLREVHIRPNLGGKKSAGVLELHKNGLRFQAAHGEKLDLIYKNISLAYFQPAEKEVLVLIHFHLHNPIMMGKKKTKDVQFYVEVMESSYALDAARRSGYDPDELEDEQRERAFRNKMNAEFQSFSRKIEEASDGAVEFDIPFRELGFYGVPPHNKGSSFIMPATNGLVELTEPPWFIAPLHEIEIAHFERVVYGLRNFDLVLVLKDFTQKPLHISAINVTHLDDLKKWFDSMNIKFYEGPANLNWTQIMNTIHKDGVENFYEEGGWRFLNLQDNDTDEEDGDPEDAESDFEPEGSESEESSSEEDDESEYDEDESGSDASGSEGLDSDESEGMDWDDAEEKAREHDKKRGRYEEDEGRKAGKVKVAKGKKKRSRDDYSD